MTLAQNTFPVAAKFEPAAKSRSSLVTEYRIYKHLHHHHQANRKRFTGLAKCYIIHKTDKHRILFVDLLGPSLEDCLNKCGRKFSLKTVLQLAIQLIDRLRTVHDAGVVFRDVKPDNFLLGPPGSEKENTVHIVDFGLAKWWTRECTIC